MARADSEKYNPLAPGPKCRVAAGSLDMGCAGNEACNPGMKKLIIRQDRVQTLLQVPVYRCLRRSEYHLAR